MSQKGLQSLTDVLQHPVDDLISCLPAGVAGVSASVDDGQVSTDGHVQVELGTVLPSSSPRPASGVLLALVLANITQRRMRIVGTSRTINMFRIIMYFELLSMLAILFDFLIS